MNETLKSLEETRVTPEQTGHLTWRLMRVAGIDPGDAIVRSDQIRYSLIGTTMLLMGAFGLFGWSCFLVLCGLLEAVPGPVGVLLMLTVAGTLVGAVLAYDRGQTSHTNAGLERMSSDGIVLGDANSTAADAGHKRTRADALLHAVAPMRMGPFAWRVLIAVAVAGVFSLSGESVFLGKDVQVQQVKEQVARDNAQIGDAKATIEQAEEDYVTKHSQYEAQLKQAQKASLSARLGQHPPGSRCKDPSTECYKRQQTANQAEENLQHLVDPILARGSGASVAEQEIASAQQEITQLRKDPSRVSAHAGGPLGHFNSLIASMKHETGALIIWVLLTSVLLALDLGALFTKRGSQLTLYEHRQAQRARLLHHEVTFGVYVDEQVRQATRREQAETRIFKVDHELDRKRTQAAERHAAEEAARTGAEAVINDPEVQEQAQERAVEELKYHIDHMPRRYGWHSGQTSNGSQENPDDGWLPPEEEFDSTQPPMQLLVPTAMLEGNTSNYELRKMIHGTEGVVEVWRATALRHEQTVAIKVYYAPEGSWDPVTNRRRNRARNEIKNTAKLEGEHVGMMLDGVFNGKPYPFLVFPFYEQGSLKDHWRDGRRSLLEVVEVGLQLIEALRLGELVHCDVKPSNVMLDGTTPRGSVVVPRVRLIDWELSRSPGELAAVEWLPRGTHRYSAPQVRLQSQTSDPRDDLYSVAAIIWQGCTGEPPGTVELGSRADVPGAGDERLRDLAKSRERQDGTAASLRELCNVPGDLSMLLDRWLSYDRGKRAGSEDPFGQAMRELGPIASRLRERADAGDQTFVGEAREWTPRQPGERARRGAGTETGSEALDSHPGYNGRTNDQNEDSRFVPGASRGKGTFEPGVGTRQPDDTASTDDYLRPINQQPSSTEHDDAPPSPPVQRESAEAQVSWRQRPFSRFRVGRSKRIESGPRDVGASRLLRRLRRNARKRDIDLD
jgi:serine/threonine protein kinase